MNNLSIIYQAVLKMCLIFLPAIITSIILPIAIYFYTKSRQA